MSTTTLFNITFYLAAPLWALIILTPTWHLTRRVMRSPWVTTLPLIVYCTLTLPRLGELWSVLSSPDLETLRAFAGTDYGAATFWAHLISFDLFLGRWMYFDSRHRGIHPLIMGPLLACTILLSPFGLLLYLIIRRSPGHDVITANRVEAAVKSAPSSVSRRLP
ncbi:ABA4-like family protein [Amycolatopsis anabasis]|uniref:ABA4-like family protein n=1 Tax=Amycolatopsis anabasis TaxID=1840409 RepID=UPI00131DF0A0|nr:ABA4-like family protein [Amycolatopsis anabasis]